MAFWSAVNPKPDATLFCDAAARADPNCQPSKMLPKNRRIEKKLFSVFSQNSRRLNSPHLFLSVSENKNNPSRFAFSISKKICKHAVDRNRYRRQAYSIIQNQLKKITDGFLFLFSLKKTTSRISFGDLEQEIKSLLST